MKCRRRFIAGRVKVGREMNECFDGLVTVRRVIRLFLLCSKDRCPHSGKALFGRAALSPRPLSGRFC